MNISASYNYNIYKISLYQNTLNSSFINSLKYLEEQSLSNNNKTQSNDLSSTIMDIYVNFTAGEVIFDYPNDCKYLNVTYLKMFSSKFFLTSYELLTLFQQDEKFYNYIFMNPLNNHKENDKKDVKALDIISTTENNKFLKDLGNESLDTKMIDSYKNEGKDFYVKKLTELLNSFNFLDLLDKNGFKYSQKFQLDFKVDKINNSLKVITFIYEGINLFDLDVKVLNEKKDGSFYTPKNSNCSLLNTNTTMSFN